MINQRTQTFHSLSLAISLLNKNKLNKKGLVQTTPNTIDPLLELASGTVKPLRIAQIGNQLEPIYIDQDRFTHFNTFETQCKVVQIKKIKQISKEGNAYLGCLYLSY